MNGRVKLSIAGLHLSGDHESAAQESCYTAEYFQKNNNHYLLYEEKQEGFDGVLKSRIKVKDKLVELTRQGPVRTHMIFEENKKHMTGYATPYGEILLGIHTKSICVTEREKEILIRIEYTLEANEEILSDCSLELRVEEQ